jgi:hypothetical protein
MWNKIELSEAQENEIRRRFNEGATQRSLAHEYGVGRAVIARVVGKRSYLRGDTHYSEAGRQGGRDNDHRHRLFKAAEKALPPDTRSRWEQWMPRPGRSALDQKRAQEAAE